MKTFKILFIPIIFLFIACKEDNLIIVKKISPDKTNNEVHVELENPSNKNYYILAPQCQIEGNGYYFHGKLDSLGYLKSEKLDKIVFDIYKSEKISIPLVLISAKSIKKIKFKYHLNIKEYPKTILYFPFNIKHHNEKILGSKLQSQKIIDGYSFYSNKIINNLH